MAYKPISDYCVIGDLHSSAVVGCVDDSGEGRWTVLKAVERGVAADKLAHALFRRFISREENSFSMRMIVALRNEFGEHAVKQQ